MNSKDKDQSKQTCGRELCCATWVRNFSSVSTNSARFQGISLNPTKLAGMCAKLKCCLNYEVDDYMDAARKLPSREVSLHTLDAEYFLVKTDILSGECTYSTDRKKLVNVEVISARRARDIIELNRQGEKPLSLHEDGAVKAEQKSADLLADGDLSRFDKYQKKRKKRKKPVATQPQTAGEAPRKPRPQSKPRGERPPREGGERGERRPRPVEGQQPQRPRRQRERGPESGHGAPQRQPSPRAEGERKEGKTNHEGE